MCHSGRKFLVSIFVELSLSKLNGVLAPCEKRKKECVAGVTEKMFLRYFTVFVHGFSYHGEVLDQISEENIVFVVSVRKDK